MVIHVGANHIRREKRLVMISFASWNIRGLNAPGKSVRLGKLFKIMG